MMLSADRNAKNEHPLIGRIRHRAAELVAAGVDSLHACRMTPHSPTAPASAHRWRAALFMLVAVGLFALMDAGLKLLSVHYPPLQVAAMRGGASLPFVLPWVLATVGIRSLFRVRWPLHLLRAVLGITMMATFVFALRTVLLAALGYAVSAITVRVLARTDSSQAIVVWLLVSMAFGAGLLALPHWVPIRGEDLWLIAGVGIAGALGQYTITEAFRRGEASLIAPLEYSALLWGVLLDFSLWGVLPDGMTWVGAAIIVLSGLYLLRRERVHLEAEHP